MAIFNSYVSLPEGNHGAISIAPSVSVGEFPHVPGDAMPVPRTTAIPKPARQGFFLGVDQPFFVDVVHVFYWYSTF
jgi:hypothetical protein